MINKTFVLKIWDALKDNEGTKQEKVRFIAKGVGCSERSVYCIINGKNNMNT